MMEPVKVWPRPFESRLTRRETWLVLGYLPIHLVVLQLAFAYLLQRGLVSSAMANLLYYLIGFLYMVLAAFRFLRRDFDALIDAPFSCLREIARCYLAMMCCNLLLGLFFLLLPETENPNNASIMSAVHEDGRVMKAALVYLTPVAEEMLFRAGIFGTLRRKNRAAAYIVSALCFALYHVALYAVIDPRYWIFLLQYLPVSLLLAACYERTSSIWCSIFFHMLINGISLSVLS